MDRPQYDVIVVGAGMAGLVAAATAAETGAATALVHDGLGSFVYGAGCVADLAAPAAAAETQALALFSRLTEAAGAPYHGGPGQQHRLYSILGTVQEAALVPAALWEGRGRPGLEVVVAGIAGLSAFDSRFLAERLRHRAAEQGLDCRYLPRDIALPRQDGLPHTPLLLANRFDADPAFRALLAQRLAPLAAEGGQLLLPSILGQRSTAADLAAFAAAAGTMPGELPTLPPSVAGLRLSALLLRQLRRAGVEVMGGHAVSALILAQGACRGVRLATPGHARTLSARAVLVAAGPHAGALLPGWSGGADSGFRPLEASGAPLARGLHVAGALLSGTGNGRAIVGGHAAALAALAA
ncbi:anaerobic glycerol-3-phosphate dehydrogenase subunit B [mine drainage metagenome]|uniref:Anaerobic glycerol-3-phosphate dehydrogenase subunit B n=1 Tax=mine drainage metagenome TaxID=410659 RepID=A0A1J5RH68_9ZZZZ